jgi:hypothetical protein
MTSASPTFLYNRKMIFELWRTDVRWHAFGHLWALRAVPDQFEYHGAVVAGLVPGTSIAMALRLHIAAAPCPEIQGRRDKRGDDNSGVIQTD